MKNNLTSLVVGLIFALGLGISGMTKPEKVIGFLDFFGNWDPSLMFVMAGAIGVHFFAYKLIRTKARPLFSEIWHFSTTQKVTPALIIGSIIFGVGWGLAGYCPGPAVVSLATFQRGPFVFVTAMLLGMWIFKIIDQKFKIDR